MSACIFVLNCWCWFTFEIGEWLRFY